MIGTIAVDGLAIECIVGILPHERTEAQVLVVDAELDYDFEPASRSENVSDTVDYVALAEMLSELARTRQYELIETFAAEATGIMLERFDGQRAKVTIRKPAAIPCAESARVTLERRR